MVIQTNIGEVKCNNLRDDFVFLLLGGNYICIYEKQHQLHHGISFHALCKDCINNPLWDLRHH